MELNPAQHRQAPEEEHRSFGADLLVVGALFAILFGFLEVGREWEHPFQASVEINLSPWWLPYYTLLSFSRGVVAYGISLLFTLLYARWAAYDRNAERILIPILDVLQSVPFPAFLAPLELLLIHIVPNSIIGLELTCILVIFTGQVWNMTFSFYYSLKSLPDDFAFVGKLARFTSWQKFTQIELPFATGGLVYNSMVSMAGGWFFLTVIESFSMGNEHFRLPGIGSYMVVAQEKGDGWAQFYAVVAMILMIVAVDQLVWRPLIVWSTKFKLEDTEAQYQDNSPILRWLSRSKLASRLRDWFKKWLQRPVVAKPLANQLLAKSRNSLRIPWRLLFIIAGLGFVMIGFYHLFLLLAQVRLTQWLTIGAHLFLTLIRVLIALLLSTLWTVPVGVWIGSNPKWARYLMPITQIAASFPSPMIFPNIVFLICLIGGNGSLEWGSVLLMMLGAQWYILFNVIAGASAIPQDLRACTQLTHLIGWQRWRTLFLPGIFPALVTGWITAAGGAWNASIVSEYTIGTHDQTLKATGLGATISQALVDNNLPLLAASVMAMAFFVVLFNRAVWKRLAVIARERYQLLT
jgi:NitT/TauT family transport system permease protein